MNSETPIKRIAIFGSTGSIGTQALNVIEASPDQFSAEVLTAHNNDELLVQQALKFKPNIVVIGDEKKYTKVKEALASTDVKVFAGEKSLDEVAAMDCFDLMLAAIVGYAGLRPTLKAIGNGKAIALANKETLVVAGDIMMKQAVENRAPIIPVDSEHSAIFQCLVGETRNRIEKIILTASGGPFLGRKPNYLADVKTFRNLVLATEALKKGGNLPCVMNAANEISVYAFLRNRINFLDMTDVIEKTMQNIPFIEKPTLEEYFESDGEARNFAADLIKL